MIFYTKIGILGEYLYVSDSYFINTLFRGKSYFIGRKIILYLEIEQWQHCMHICYSHHTVEPFLRGQPLWRNNFLKQSFCCEIIA